MEGGTPGTRWPQLCRVSTVGPASFPASVPRQPPTQYTMVGTTLACTRVCTNELSAGCHVFRTNRGVKLAARRPCCTRMPPGSPATPVSTCASCARGSMGMPSTCSSKGGLRPVEKDPYYTVYEIECETPLHRYVGFTNCFESLKAFPSFPLRNAFTTRHGVKRVSIITQVATEAEAKHRKNRRNRYWRSRSYTTAVWPRGDSRAAKTP